MSQEFVEQLVWNMVNKFILRVKSSFKKKKPETQQPKENKTLAVEESSENSKSEEEKNKNEEIAASTEQKNDEVLDTAIFFHFTIFLLWLLVAGLCIPSVLTWAHNFK